MERQTGIGIACAALVLAVVQASGDRGTTSTETTFSAEVWEAADSLAGSCDSLGVSVLIEDGQLNSSWEWVSSSNVLKLNCDSLAEGPLDVGSWLTSRGWVQLNGGDAQCGTIGWFGRGRLRCEVHENWGPCFDPGEFEDPAEEDSVVAAEYWHHLTVRFCEVPDSLWIDR